MNAVKIAIAFVIVALAGLAIAQWHTIGELRHEIERLNQQVAQIGPLQDQLAQAAPTPANSAGGNTAARDAQARDLARLRNEVSQLRGVAAELAKAKAQIAALNERLGSEAEARKDVAAETDQNKPAAAGAHADAQELQRADGCIANLRLIDAAKQQWALEFKKQATDTPTMDDLRPYLGLAADANLPFCADGGAYTIGTVGEKPTCSMPGHVLH